MTTYKFNEGCGKKTITVKKGESITINYIAEYKREDFVKTTTTDGKEEEVLNITPDSLKSGRTFNIYESGNNVIIKRTNSDDQIVIKNMSKTEIKNLLFESIVKINDLTDADKKNGVQEETVTFTQELNEFLFPVHLYVNSKGNTGFKYTGNQLSQEIIATPKNDTIKVGGGKINAVFGGEGNDKIYASSSSDFFHYGINSGDVFDTKSDFDQLKNLYQNGKIVISNSKDLSLIKDDVVAYYYSTMRGTVEIPCTIDETSKTIEINYKGDGSDTIYNAKSNDAIVFSSLDGIDELTFSRDANNLIMKSDTENIKVTLSKYFKNTSNRLDNLYFGIVEEGTEAESMAEYFETNGIIEYKGSGKMTGSDFSETFIGGKKADTIYTKGGNDRIIAGAGNDKIHINGSGEKTIEYYGYDYSKYVSTSSENIVNIKEGNDILYIEDKDAEVNISLEGNVEDTEIYKVSANGKDLIITLNNTETDNKNTITVKNYFLNYSNLSISGSKFSDILETSGISLTGKSSKKNTLMGTKYEDTIIGGKKADKIYTGSGNDIVIAGKGNDKIYLDGAGVDTKTIKINKGDGTDTIYFSCNYNDLTADIVFGDENNIADDIIYSSNGKNLIITAHYDAVKNENGKVTAKAVNDKAIISNYFNDTKTPTIKLGGEEIKWSEIQLKITGSYNKKKKTYTFVGTQYNDIITGTNKTDIINAGDGNNIITAGAKGKTTITAGAGDDTYYIKNMNNIVTITDAGGNDDTLNLSGIKLENMNYFFDVKKDGTIGSTSLYMLSDKGANNLSSGKLSNYINISDFFASEGIQTNDSDSSNTYGSGYIENFSIEGVDIKMSAFDTLFTDITKAVSEFLETTNYTSAFEVLNDKSKAGKAALKEMVKIYQGYKMGISVNYDTQQAEALYNNINSQVASWQNANSLSFDTVNVADINTDNSQDLILQYCNN